MIRASLHMFLFSFCFVQKSFNLLLFFTCIFFFQVEKRNQSARKRHFKHFKHRIIQHLLSSYISLEDMVPAVFLPCPLSPCPLLLWLCLFVSHPYLDRHTERESETIFPPLSLSPGCYRDETVMALCCWKCTCLSVLSVCLLAGPFAINMDFFFLALSLCSAVSRYPTNLPPCSPHSPAWVICVRAPLKLLTCRAGLRNSISSPFRYTCTYVHFCKTWAESDGMDITQTVLSFSAFPPSGEGAASCTEYVRSSHFLMAWGTGAILTGFLLMRFPYMWPQNTQSWL